MAISELEVRDPCSCAPTLGYKTCSLSQLVRLFKTREFVQMDGRSGPGAHLLSYRTKSNLQIDVCFRKYFNRFFFSSTYDRVKHWEETEKWNRVGWPNIWEMTVSIFFCAQCPNERRVMPCNDQLIVFSWGRLWYTCIFGTIEINLWYIYIYICNK